MVGRLTAHNPFEQISASVVPHREGGGGGRIRCEHLRLAEVVPNCLSRLLPHAQWVVRHILQRHIRRRRRTRRRTTTTTNNNKQQQQTNKQQQQQQQQPTNNNNNNKQTNKQTNKQQQQQQTTNNQQPIAQQQPTTTNNKQTTTNKQTNNNNNQQTTTTNKQTNNNNKQTNNKQQQQQPPTTTTTTNNNNNKNGKKKTESSVKKNKVEWLAYLRFGCCGNNHEGDSNHPYKTHPGAHCWSVLVLAVVSFDHEAHPTFKFFLPLAFRSTLTGSSSSLLLVPVDAPSTRKWLHNVVENEFNVPIALSAFRDNPQCYQSWLVLIHSVVSVYTKQNCVRFRGEWSGLALAECDGRPRQPVKSQRENDFLTSKIKTSD